jgi:uncharacterized repeat protein (TIGR03803 family)
MKNKKNLASVIACTTLFSTLAPAQTFTTLYNFTPLSSIPFVVPSTNSDGANPYARLIFSDNTLYGTAAYGGQWGNGVVFRVNVDGAGFTNLHSFAALDHNTYNNSDGVNPMAGLILLGNTLYGTTTKGGSSGNGTVFAVDTDGTSFTNLHSFTAVSFPQDNPHTNFDGANPHAGLIFSGNTLYGTAAYGGRSGSGTVFAICADGSGFTNLYSFSETSGFNHSGTNRDGAEPYAGLILIGNTLYGTTLYGGNSGSGTVFAVNTNGSDFTNLYSFTAKPGFDQFGTNNDGAEPYAGLIFTNNILYGTTQYGGSSGPGTTFAVNIDGTSFTNLHSFTAVSELGYPPTNSDGAISHADLVQSDNSLYGTTTGGGNSGNGTIFTINADGTSFTNVYTFTPLMYYLNSSNNSIIITNSDGASPAAGLILCGDTLFGTTSHGGTNGAGTVFSLSFAPRLTITPFGAIVILTWPTHVAGFDYSGFTLQSSTNLGSTAAWYPVSPLPVIVSGENVVTNLISDTQKFYRLSP